MLRLKRVCLTPVETNDFPFLNPLTAYNMSHLDGVPVYISYYEHQVFSAV